MVPGYNILCEMKRAECNRGQTDSKQSITDVRRLPTDIRSPTHSTLYTKDSRCYEITFMFFRFLRTLFIHFHNSHANTRWDLECIQSQTFKQKNISGRTCWINSEENLSDSKYEPAYVKAVNRNRFFSDFLFILQSFDLVSIF